MERHPECGKDYALVWCSAPVNGSSVHSLDSFNPSVTQSHAQRMALAVGPLCSLLYPGSLFAPILPSAYYSKKMCMGVCIQGTPQ